MSADGDKGDESTSGNNAASTVSERSKSMIGFGLQGLVGIFLLGCAFFDSYLFVLFTPVYLETSCGDVQATLKEMSLGNTIKVGLEVQVTCWNPNVYGVQIQSAMPGSVFIGDGRELSVGNLELVDGSELPAQGSGHILVSMDAELSAKESMALAPRFLSNKETPVFIALEFDVDVHVDLGITTFETVAPFKKKCGLHIGGLLSESSHALGPLLCGDTFEELDGRLPHAWEAPSSGNMSFSAAQVDGERIRLGECLKNLVIVGSGLICYALGVFLTRPWLRAMTDAEAAAAARWWPGLPGYMKVPSGAALRRGGASASQLAASSPGGLLLVGEAAAEEGWPLPGPKELSLPEIRSTPRRRLLAALESARFLTAMLLNLGSGGAAGDAASGAAGAAALLETAAAAAAAAADGADEEEEEGENDGMDAFDLECGCGAPAEAATDDELRVEARAPAVTVRELVVVKAEATEAPSDDEADGVWLQL